MADDSNSIIVKLTAQGDEFKSGIDSALSSITAFTTALATNPVIAAAAAVAAIVEFTMSIADLGDELNDMRERTGMSVEGLSTLKYAAELSGADINDVATAMKALSKNMTEATTGNEKAAAAFRALGVDVEALSALTPDEQFLVMAEAIGKVEDPSLKAALAIETMGKGAIALLPMMADGAEGVVKMQEEAQKLGLQMSGDSAKSADAFNDSLHAVWVQVKQISYDIGAVFLPPLKTLFDWISKLVSVFKDGFIAVLNAALGVVLMLAGQGIATLYLGITKLTDALGVTNDASKDAAYFLKLVQDMATQAGIAAVNAAASMVSSNADAATSEKKVADAKAQVKTMTEAQARAELTAADAAKKAKEAQAAQYKDAMDSLNLLLEYKKKIGQYDDEYFAAYAAKLDLQGYNEQQVSDLIAEERKGRADQESKQIQDSIKQYLDYKKKIGEYDDDYFDAYYALLKEQKISDSDIQKLITAERKKQNDARVDDDKLTNSLIKKAGEEAADAIKTIWSDEQVETNDIWKRGADQFVDTLMPMLVKSATETAYEVQWQMALATTGITLAAAALSALFSDLFGGGGGHEQSQLAKDFEEFFSNLEDTLASFEDDVYSTITKLSNATVSGESGLSGIEQSIADYLSAYNDLLVAVNNMDFDAIRSAAEDMNTAGNSLLSNLDDTEQAIIDRYDLEEGLINDIFDLLSEKEDWVKSLESDITDVSRALLSDQELYDAQQNDISRLWASLSVTSDAEDQLAILSDLQAAYDDLWSTAQSLYSEDATSLAEVQQQVVSGLLAVQQQGVSSYDDLINVNLEMLEVQRTGTDLQQQMTDLLASIQDSAVNALQTIQDFGDGLISSDQFVSLLAGFLSGMGFDIPAMATGGIVNSPTLAMIGEAGPEAVVPLSQLSGMGGGTWQVNVYGQDIRNMTESDWVDALKKAKRAAERLGKSGYTWGMPARA